MANLAPSFGIEPSEMAICLFDDTPPTNPRLLEICQATVLAAKPRSIRQFVSHLTARLRSARLVTYATRYVPASLVPQQWAPKYTRLTNPEAVTRSRFRLLRAVDRAVRKVLVETSNDCRITLLPTVKNNLHCVTQRKAPFDSLTTEQTEEFRDEVERGISAHGVVLIEVDDAHPKRAAALGELFDRCSEVLALDDQMVVKRLPKSGAWLVLERNGDAAMDQLIDFELQRLADLCQRAA